MLRHSPNHGTLRLPNDDDAMLSPYYLTIILILYTESIIHEKILLANCDQCNVICIAHICGCQNSTIATYLKSLKDCVAILGKDYEVLVGVLLVSLLALLPVI